MLEVTGKFELAHDVKMFFHPQIPETVHVYRYVGKMLSPMYRHGEEGKFPLIENEVYFCPECGKVWGRLVNDKCVTEITANSNSITEFESFKWHSVTRNCEEHGDGSFISRNVWSIWSVETIMEVYSYEILRREIVLYARTARS